MAFCVGRWVAAIRVTATARPSRAMESVSLIASGGFVGQLGVFIDEDHERGHCRGYRPSALSGCGEQCRACFQHGDRVPEKS